MGSKCFSYRQSISRSKQRSCARRFADGRDNLRQWQAVHDFRIWERLCDHLGPEFEVPVPWTSLAGDPRHQKSGIRYGLWPDGDGGGSGVGASPGSIRGHFARGFRWTRWVFGSQRSTVVRWRAVSSCFDKLVQDRSSWVERVRPPRNEPASKYRTDVQRIPDGKASSTGERQR
jgi:hypothetical protein